MFTGIIEEVGQVARISKSGRSARLTIGCKAVLNDTKLGDSIAVNGVCLTVIRMDGGSFDADISYETLDRSSLGSASSGTPVNLERALTLSTRLGGHLVSGHVDGIGRMSGLSRVDDAYRLTVSYPQELGRYIVEKGSITIDGISLTVTGLTESTFDVAVIPHTLENTILKQRRGGDAMNLEVDVIARYVEKLLKNEPKSDKLNGFLGTMLSMGEGY